jgi:hypothetical protein
LSQRFASRLTFFGAVRYIETIAGARIPARRFYGVPLLAFARSKFAGPHKKASNAFSLPKRAVR